MSDNLSTKLRWRPTAEPNIQEALCGGRRYLMRSAVSGAGPPGYVDVSWQDVRGRWWWLGGGTGGPAQRVWLQQRCRQHIRSVGQAPNLTANMPGCFLADGCGGQHFEALRLHLYWLGGRWQAIYEACGRPLSDVLAEGRSAGKVLEAAMRLIGEDWCKQLRTPPPPLPPDPEPS